MAEIEIGWKRVLTAFDDWIAFEASKFGPWTAYFSIENLQALTKQERLGWLYKMRDELIPQRVDKCREAGIALEDFLPYMPNEDAIATVRRMIDLTNVLQESMLRMSDILNEMIEHYKTGGLEDISPLLSDVTEIEEDIRHHMSLYSHGFGRLKALGLEIPEEML